MSVIDDVLFPLRIAKGASGGPEWRTDVLALASGSEVRNASWANSRRRWDVASAVQTLDDLHEVLSFFEARRGRLRAFRFRDFSDHKSAAKITPTDQRLGVGDGEQTSFPLIKTYGDVVRAIPWPVRSSLLVAVGHQEVFDWSYSNGEIVFDTPPDWGVPVSAGFVFDCAARFDTDRLDIRAEGFGAGRIVSVPIIEVTG